MQAESYQSVGHQCLVLFGNALLKLRTVKPYLVNNGVKQLREQEIQKKTKKYSKIKEIIGQGPGQAGAEEELIGVPCCWGKIM